MSLVKWIPEFLTCSTRSTYYNVPVIHVTDLTELVEMLRTNIAHSFINTDEMSAYRLACEHLLTQLQAHREEGAQAQRALTGKVLP